MKRALVGIFVIVAVQASYADDRVERTPTCVLPFLEKPRAIETLANAVLAKPTEKPISYTAIAEVRTTVPLLQTVSSARMKVTAGATIISIATKF